MKKTSTELVKDSKHFCILPWIHFHAWPDKRVLPCCVADSEQHVAEIKDGESILDMMNSEGYKKMRLAMLNDEAVSACTRCYELEEYGTWTMRQSQNTVRGMNNIDIVDITNEDGSLPEFKLKYMDIRFSNICNFKCRSCGPACSNLWGEEKMKEMDGDTARFEESFKLKDILVSNTDDNDFMTRLKPHLNEVEECYFAGGEILVTPEHYECLDYWVENDLTDQVHLNYTTNMSKLTYRDKNGTRDLFDYWDKFPNIEIWASLDSVGDSAEIIRKGTNWKKIVKNLELIKKRAPHIKLGFTPTISLWNIWSYHELFDYLHDAGLLDAERPPRINILTQPEWASITNLPEHIAYPLIRIYEKQMHRHMEQPDDWTDADMHLAHTFLILLTALKEARGNVKQLKQFIAENRRMDTSRQEYILDSIPELEDLYKWTMEQEDR